MNAPVVDEKHCPPVVVVQAAPLACCDMRMVSKRPMKISCGL